MLVLMACSVHVVQQLSAKLELAIDIVIATVRARYVNASLSSRNSVKWCPFNVTLINDFGHTY